VALSVGTQKPLTPGAARDLGHYLNVGASGRRWTPNTWTCYNVGGKAGTYQWFYVARLDAAIAREVTAGNVIPVRSERGSTAYVRVHDATLAELRQHIADCDGGDRHVPANVLGRYNYLALRAGRANPDGFAAGVVAVVEAANA
jgi:hypothetical protein